MPDLPHAQVLLADMQHAAPLRVCHLLASVGVCGGLEKNVFELGRAQAALGLEVTLVVDPSLAHHAGPGVNVIPRCMQRSRLNAFNLIGLRTTLAQLRPDLIHAHASKAAALLRVVRPFLRAVPTLATVHNVKSSTRPFRGYTRLIAVSEVVRRSLGGLSATVVWNAISPPDPAEREAARASRPPFVDSAAPVICSVGRMVPAKGFDLLLRALVQVPHARLWLVGDGPLHADLQRLSVELGLVERVWFAGHRSDALGLMACAQLCVIASRHEGGPYTLAEALHLRAPVLSTEVGFAPELLPAQALVPALDVDALAAGLRRALADLPAYTALLEPSFAQAGEALTLTAMTARVLTVYRDCLPLSAQTGELDRIA